jgi:hypothetical protein
MAHLSGYGGTVAFVGASGAKVFAPATTDLKVLDWELDQETDTFEARAKSDSHVETFAGASRWSGRMTFLVQSGMETSGNSLEIRAAANDEKAMDATLTYGTSITHIGDAIVTRMTSRSPVDGPCEHVVEFKGGTTADLTVVGAGPV